MPTVQLLDRPPDRTVCGAAVDSTAFGGPSRWQAKAVTDRGPMVFHAVPFDTEAFAPGAFDRAGIAFPESIRRSVRKRQAEFFFGRVAARLALSRVMPMSLQVPIGPRGEPVWPSGVIGSISHTKDLAVATALATGSGAPRGVGIDVEHVLDERACRVVSSSVVDKGELDYLQRIRELPPAIVLTTVFSAKESLYKGAYSSVRRLFDFSAARVSAMDVHNGRLSLELTETLSGDFVRGQQCNVEFRFAPAGQVLTYFVW